MGKRSLKILSRALAKDDVPAWNKAREAPLCVEALYFTLTFNHHTMILYPAIARYEMIRKYHLLFPCL